MEKERIERLIKAISSMEEGFERFSYPFDYSFGLDLNFFIEQLDACERYLAQTGGSTPPSLMTSSDIKAALGEFDSQINQRFYAGWLLDVLDNAPEGTKINMVPGSRPSFALENIYRSKILLAFQLEDDRAGVENNRVRDVDSALLSRVLVDRKLGDLLSLSPGRSNDVRYLSDDNPKLIKELSFSLGGYGKYLSVSACLYNGARINFSNFFCVDSNIYISNRDELPMQLDKAIGLMVCINDYFGVVYE
ncbi:hypothetical protein NF212_19040 [Parasalinivibrio latis]|uniref:hypothetical protein n=1 Tax=Parasalinivibrio latis TaxID=2952610 RepID=UPI0030E53FA4